MRDLGVFFQPMVALFMEEFGYGLYCVRLRELFADFQIIFFNKNNFKNESNSIIYIFKNYFVIIFLIFNL